MTQGPLWYTQQALVNDINTDSSTNLDDKIEQYVESRSVPNRKLVLKSSVENPSPLDFDVGDRVMIDLPDAEISELRRLRKKTLYIGDNDYMSLEFSYDNE